MKQLANMCHLQISVKDLNYLEWSFDWIAAENVLSATVGDYFEFKMTM